MKKISSFITLLPAFGLIMPLVALAIDEDAFDIIFYLINSAIAAAIGIGTIVFLVGVIKYVMSQGDETKLKAGRQYMLYGIIGLTVMVAVWGFVNVVIYTIFGSATDLGKPNVTPFGEGSGTRPSGEDCILFWGFCI